MTIPKKILVVDDDPDLRDTMRIVLERAGYHVQTAINGQEAIAALEAERPDLMILDIMMTTDTEGFDLAYELKDRSGCETLPIILLTSFLDKVRAEGPDPFQHVLGEAWPARWMFEKPVPPATLLAKIQGILAGEA